MTAARGAGWRRAAPALPIAVLAALLIHTGLETSVTADEFAHLPSGLAYWQTGDFSIYNQSPPLLRLLAAGPVALAGVEAPLEGGPLERWHLGERFQIAHAAAYHEIFLAARLVVVILTCTLAALLFWAGSRAIGPGGAWLAAGLFAVCPTVLAHGGLVTTDAGFALAFFGTCAAAARLFARPSWLAALGLGVVLGLAQLTKFTALLLYPMLLLFAAALPHVAGWLAGGEALGWVATRPAQRARFVAGALLVSVLILNAGYGFQGTGRALASHEFTHPLLRGVAGTPLGWLPFPLPEQFLIGFDDQYREASSHFSVYLLGETRRGGWPQYYLVTLFLKLPLPLFLLLGALGVLLIRGRIPLTPVLAGSLAVVAVGFALFAAITDIDLGVRYLLFLLPFLHLAVAHLALPPVSRVRQALLGFGFGWFAISSLLNHPQYLAYFSEAVGGPRQGHRYLADSNLDWGQDLIRLRRFMDAQGLTRVALSNFGLVDPAVYGIAWDPLPAASEPAPPVAVVSVNHLLGIHPWGKPPGVERYRGRAPDARVGWSLWVFREPNSREPLGEVAPRR